MSVTGATRQRDGLCEIHSDLAYCMRIRSKSDGYALLVSHLDNFWARINLFAIPSQSRGIEFHCEAVLLRGSQELADQRRIQIRKVQAGRRLAIVFLCKVQK